MKRTSFLLLVILAAGLVNGQSVEPLRIMNGPWIQNLNETGLTIFFTTNLPVVPAVMLSSAGEEPEVRITNSTDGIIDAGGTLHRVRVEGLQPGTQYRYRIQAIEILKYRPYQVWYGDTLYSRAQTIRTADPDSPVVSFMVFNDIHEKSGFLAQHLKQAEPAAMDFIVYNGDMLNYFEKEPQIFDAVIDTSVRYFAGSTPFLWVRGNHETRGMLARTFKEYLDYPDGSFYFAFSRGPVRFIVLDCGEDKPDDNQYYYRLADYDRYRLKQLEWLREELKSDAYLEASFRVVIIHMPVHPGDGKWHGQNFLARHFGPVLKEAGADLMLSAHTHRHQWIDQNESGLGFPILVNAPGDRIEVHSDREELKIEVISAEGNSRLSKELTSR